MSKLKTQPHISNKKMTHNITAPIRNSSQEKHVMTVGSNKN